MSSVTYFANFLGLKHQDIASITANDLRQFIIAFEEKRKFSMEKVKMPEVPETVECLPF